MRHKKTASRASPSRAAPRTKAGKKAKVHKVMKEFSHGELKSGHGGKVKSRAQAVAIAMHESGQSRKSSSAHA